MSRTHIRTGPLPPPCTQQGPLIPVSHKHGERYRPTRANAALNPGGPGFTVVITTTKPRKAVTGLVISLLHVVRPPLTWYHTWTAPRTGASPSLEQRAVRGWCPAGALGLRWGRSALERPAQTPTARRGSSSSRTWGLAATLTADDQADANDVVARTIGSSTVEPSVQQADTPGEFTYLRSV